VNSGNYEHMDVEYEEVLEYEVQDDDDPSDASAVKVCVVEPVVTIPGASQYVTAYTVVVETDGNEAYAEVLPYDPLRTRATLIVSTQPVVLTHSLSDAQDSRNQVTSVPNPQGAYLPVSTTAVVMTHTGRMWVAATTAESAARVSVIVERRGT
jgi:hypothetical protein